jgi:hypothetical protein
LRTYSNAQLCEHRMQFLRVVLLEGSTSTSSDNNNNSLVHEGDSAATPEQQAVVLKRLNFLYKLIEKTENVFL